MKQSSPSKARVLWVLFFEFFKIASWVVGGGYAILAVADEVFTRKLKWLDDGELDDTLALMQTVPGLIAGNLAIYIGYRKAGFLGSLCAILGVALPSYIIITIIAIFFSTLRLESVWAKGALVGVRTAVAALTLSIFLRLWKTSIRSGIQATVFAICVAAMLIFHVNPGWIILGSLLLGILWCLASVRCSWFKLPQDQQLKEIAHGRSGK